MGLSTCFRKAKNLTKSDHAEIRQLADALKIEDGLSEQAAVLQAIDMFVESELNAYQVLHDKITEKGGVIPTPEAFREKYITVAPADTSAADMANLSDDDFESLMNDAAPDPAAAALKAAARHGVKGADEALTGLTELFGGKKLSSGFTFDEDTYAKAKPHFKKSLEEFVAAGKSLSEFIQFIVGNFGQGIKPYLKKFHQDVKASEIKIRGIHDDADAGQEQPAPDSGTLEAQTEPKGDDDVQRNRDNQADDSGGNADLLPGTDEEGATGQQPAGDAGNDGARDLFSADQSAPATESTGLSGSRAGNRGDRAPGQGNKPAQPVRNNPSETPANYRITGDEGIGEGGPLQKARQNVDAIRIAIDLRDNKRHPTKEEQIALSKFVGWGNTSIKNKIFPADDADLDGTWSELRNKLDSMLSKEEIETAKRSGQYAHFTSLQVIDSIYNALKQFGVTSGAAFEGGVGSGNFIGRAPQDIDIQFTGVEMDGISAAITSGLYPQSSIFHKDFQKLPLPQNYYDLIIGNPPFADIVIKGDKRYNRFKFRLHDYFLAKQMDSLRPGGIMSVVVSKGTMDKADDATRKYLAERADLIGAIRLPNTAFKANAGTEVVTDILFFQRKTEGAASGIDNDFTSSLKTTIDGEEYSVNQYYHDNPHMVLGKQSSKGSMYGSNEYTVESTGNLEEQLATALATLPKNIVTHNPTAADLKEKATQFELSTGQKEGAYYIDDAGALRQTSGGVGVRVQVRGGSVRSGMTKKDAQIVRDFISLREALTSTFNAMLADGDWKAAQKVLNREYDVFVDRHGPINTTTEKVDKAGRALTRTPILTALALDPDGYRVAALETYDISTNTATKRAIFTENVVATRKEAEIDAAEDVLKLSLNEFGHIDIDWMADKYDSTKENVIEELGDSIFFDPSLEQWVAADQYLSGNIKEKLRLAKESAGGEVDLTHNIAQLETVVPADRLPSQVKARLGTHWIPLEVIEDFAREVLDYKGKIFKSIQGNRSNWSTNGKSDNQVYATNATPAEQILSAALNKKQIVVKVTVSDGHGGTTQVTDKPATAAAADKVQQITDKFSQWVSQDDKASRLVTDLFNEKFNSMVPREYDGSHLTFPRLSNKYALRKWQRDVVWRIINRGNTYMAHTVGSGKTLASIVAGMEMRRLGIVKKPTYVVLKSTLAQFSAEFYDAYPDAQILIADETKMANKHRRQFLAQMAMGDWDAVIYTHDSFKEINMSAQYTEDYIQTEIDEYRAALEDVDKADRITRGNIERAIQRMEEEMQGASNAKFRVLEDFSMEELGIDFLFIDEAHHHKKIPIVTEQGNIKGVATDGSQIARDLLMKTTYLNQLRPGKHTVLMSGTPVTNTMGEIFNIQRYLQPEALEAGEISSFDSWSAMFANLATDLEMQPSGNFKPVTRMKEFTNLSALMRDFLDVADIVGDAQLNESAEIERPAIAGGAREIVVTEASQELKDYQVTLGARIKALEKKTGRPQKGDDNILVVILDGRKSAVDMRLVGRPQTVPSKLDNMIDSVFEEWERTQSDVYLNEAGNPEHVKGSTQLIFSEIRKSAGFDIFEYIRGDLVKRGVPANEVVFIQDYNTTKKKAKLFKDFNAGRIRILLGGSQNLGTGTNVQVRGTALHHLDIDYLPANITQREGRLIRAGNQNDTVALRAYATSGTIDATMWQINQSKQAMVDDVMNGNLDADTVSDVSDNVNQMAMAKALASGNPLVLEQAGLSAEVQKLQALRDAFYDQKFRGKRISEELTVTIADAKAAVPEVAALAEQYTSTKGDAFTAKIGKKVYDERRAFGDALIIEIARAVNSGNQKPVKFGEVAGYGLYINNTRDGWYPVNLTLGDFGTIHDPKAESNWSSPLITSLVDRYNDKVIGDIKALGIVAKIENHARSYVGAPDLLQEAIADAEKKLSNYSDMSGEFQYQKDLDEKAARLKEVNAEMAADSAADELGPEDAVSIYTGQADAVVIRSEDGSVLNGAWSVDTPGGFPYSNMPTGGFQTEQMARDWMRDQGGDRTSTTAPGAGPSSRPAATPEPAASKPEPAWSDAQKAAIAKADALMAENESTGFDRFTLAQTTHAKKNIDLYVASLNDRVDREEYRRLVALAKVHGGYYSRFAKNGAIPGFQFESEADRRAFMVASEDGVSEEAGLYSGYERDSSKVSGQRQADNSVSEPADILFAQPDLFSDAPAEVQQAQAKDNLFVRYKQVESEQLNVGIDRVNDASDAAHIFAPIRKRAQESFYVLVLDADNKPVNLIRHTEGVKDGANIDPLIVIAAASNTPGAKSVWIAHNHPSGVTMPSQADVSITKTLDTGLATVAGLKMNGHIILGDSKKATLIGENGQIDITPARRNKRIAVTTRQLRKKATAERVKIDSPIAAREVVEKLESNNALVLLDNRNQVAGVLSFDPDEMAELRSNGRVERILKAIDESNAIGGIIAADSKRYAANLARMLNNFNTFRVHDAIIHQNGGKPYSSAEHGEDVHSAKGRFYDQRPAGAPQPTGVDRKIVEIQSAEFLKGLNLSEKIDVKIYDTAEDLVRDLNVSPEQASTALGFIQGNQLYLIAGNLSNPSEIQPLLRHEVLAHYGLDALETGDKLAILKKIAASRHVPFIKQHWDEVAKTYDSKLNGRPLKIAEEVFARIAELDPAQPPKVWERIVDMVMKALRKVGLYRNTMTRSDARALLKAISKGITHGSPRSDEIRAMVAWQESPHDHNKFDSANLGTGEGAHVYGWGHYFASEREVAEHYREVLSSPTSKQEVLYDGEPIQHFPKKLAARYMTVNDNDKDAAIAMTRGLSRPKAELDKIVAEINKIDPTKVEIIGRGKVYKVSLAPGVNDYLRWDEPFDRQPKAIQEAFIKLLGNSAEYYNGLSMTGGDLYRKLERTIGEPSKLGAQAIGLTGKDVYGDIGHINNDEFASRALLALGVRGVKYLDGGSRMKGVGTFNYVVFDDADIEIEQKFNLRPDDPITESAKRKAGLVRETYSHKVRRVIGNLFNEVAHHRQAHIDSWRQGTVDRFHGIKLAQERNLGNLQAEQSPYVAARLSTGISSVMRGILLKGQPQWAKNKQHLEKKAGTKGLLEILSPVADDIDDFIGWMVGNRAARLMNEDKENNFTKAEIKALQKLGKGKYKQFQEVAREFAAFKRSVLDVAQQAGLIDPEARKVWDLADWIPFYRQIESEDSTLGPTGAGKSLANKSSGVRQLHGGEDALNDPLENIIMNFHRLLDASLKNNATQKAIEAAPDVVEKAAYEFQREIVPKSEVKRKLKEGGMPEDMIEMLPQSLFKGLGKMWAIKPPSEPDVIRVMYNGKPKYFRVSDPLLLRALTSYKNFDFAGLGAARAFKRVLTAAVTATPEFMLRNFIRDTASTAIISRNAVAAAGAFKGFMKAYNESGGAEHMLFAGASFASGHIDGTDTEETARAVRRSLRKKGLSAADVDGFMGSIIDSTATYWDKYRHVSEAIENANREAVYESALEATGSETAAVFEAKDLMDFSLRGDWPMYQVMADVLPFFNARVQGMYRLARTDPKQATIRGAIMLVLPSILLALAHLGNEEYEELPDWDKDTYWHFWLAGEHFRIPKPFEVGVIFATIPERMISAMFGQDDMIKFGKRMAWNAMEQLNLVDMPQIIKPAVEVAINYNTFAGRTIENMADEKKSPRLRYSGRTSSTMRELVQLMGPVADEIGLSPKKAEHLVNGYLGTFGAWGLALTDVGARLLAGDPAKPLLRPDDMPVIRVLYRGKEGTPYYSTQHITDVYEGAREYARILSDYRALAKEGKIDDADEILAKHEDRLMILGPMFGAARAVSALNAELDRIMKDPDLTPAEKREKIDERLKERNQYAKKGVEKYREKVKEAAAR